MVTDFIPKKKIQNFENFRKKVWNLSIWRFQNINFKTILFAFPSHHFVPMDGKRNRRQAGRVSFLRHPWNDLLHSHFLRWPYNLKNINIKSYWQILKNSSKLTLIGKIQKLGYHRPCLAETKSSENSKKTQSVKLPKFQFSKSNLVWSERKVMDFSRRTHWIVLKWLYHP